MRKSKLTIAICTFNRVDLLIETIQSLSELKNINDAQVIIVDNNSTDGTRAEVEKLIGDLNYNLEYINEKRQGLSYARNTAIQRASCEYIAFLDDDAIPDSEWINTIIAAFEKDLTLYAIGGKIIPKFETDRPDWLVKGLEYSYTIVDLGSNKQQYPSKLYPFGANMAFRTSVFNKYEFPNHLGRKGTTLISGEETWLFSKIQEEGWNYCYIPGMVVEHFVPKERLTKKWVLERFYFQGVTKKLMCTNKKDKIKLFIETFIKFIYVNIKAPLLKGEGEILLNECRRNSVRGAWNRAKKK
ncbi:glycosyltransferase [Bacillus cereus group sp. MYBK245-2]|uniref:GalNAc(5)-diNAcBac-PP-undecaprenol beta-1,3-glucosyltransferase n=1 Tax=Bacillus pacificus TaxID=2026187 RepID=A0A1Y5Z3A8_9BACI|nr:MULTISPECIES: glycosyltransferase [Bacteria]MCZ7522056.1 glycosyltransferase family 2 protein [Bacillus pacificus]MDA1573907.1 glycosyltransferase [Bacillus cereus group sp. TH242-3LC]MDQ4681582.1 glycosyltransferase [Stenotrophomonas maltophilia group sp. RNC7]MED1586513.1 glycosyltransferase [Bacillus pacificus]UTG89244.1 glycosyltransferase [Bacillus pacificus]